MTRKLKPSEARRMRKQKEQLERDLQRLTERATKFSGSWLGVRALEEAKEAREKISILALKRQ